MELSELLARFNRGEVVGENREAVEEMRRFSREAQKITMAINTRYHEPEELATLFSELIGEPVGADFGLFPRSIPISARTSTSAIAFLSTRAANFRIRAGFLSATAL